MKKRMVWCLISSLFIACGENEIKTKLKTEIIETNQDTIETEEVYDFATSLPGLKGSKLLAEDYLMEEMLASIVSETNKGQLVHLVVSNEEQLILQIANDQNSEIESIEFFIGAFNPYFLEIKMEWVDANRDDLKDELAIWWNTGDGNNGLLSGYEMERKGLIIFDVLNRTDLVNFVYHDYYSSYMEGPNADIDNEEYHAKMAEDSEWEICSFSHEVIWKKGQVIVSNPTQEVEGEGECLLMLVEPGAYELDYTSNQFELKK